MHSVVVLVTGVGAPGAPGIIRSLRDGAERERRDISIVGTDADSDASGKVLCNEFRVVPSGDSDYYIDAMKKVVRGNAVDVVLPLTGQELLPLSKNKELLNVCISEPKAICVAEDKYQTFRKFESLIPVPAYILTRTADGFVAAAEKLGYPEKLVCFKPPISNGGRGFRILDSVTDNKYTILNNKPEENIRVRLGAITAIFEWTEPFPQLLVMEYLPGHEYSIDGLAREGKLLVGVPRLREKVKSGVSVKTRVVERQGLVNALATVVGKLKMHGPVGIQMKKSETGVYKLLECNPRLHGGTGATTASGVNIPWLSVKLHLEEDFEIPVPEYGWRMIRRGTEYYEHSAS